MGVGCRRRGGGRRRAGGAGRRRRARARHHRTNHHRRQQHHGQRTGSSPLFRLMLGRVLHTTRRSSATQNQSQANISSTMSSAPASVAVDSTTTTTTTTTTDRRAYANIFTFGFLLMLPGTIMTCIAISTGGSFAVFISGTCMLGLGGVMTIGTVFLSLLQDRKTKSPRQHPSWNVRVRKDTDTVSWLLILVGSALAITAFIPAPLLIFVSIYSSLGIASLCIIGLGEIILIVGLAHGRVTRDEEASDTASAAEDSVYGALGWALVIPGICLSCVGWTRYHNLIPGTIGAVMLGLGSALVIAAAIKKVKSATSNTSASGTQSVSGQGSIDIKRSAIVSVTRLCFLCGIIFTPVGFTNLPVGQALGIVGACALGISFIGNIIYRCSYKPPLVPPTNGPDVELGHQPAAGIGVTNTNNQLDDDLPSYNVASGMPMPPPATHITTGSAPSFYLAQSVPSAPGYIEPGGASYPVPSFPPPEIHDAQYIPVIHPGTPASGFGAATNTVDDDNTEPPPPSYDDVIKGMADHDVSFDPPTNSDA